MHWLICLKLTVQDVTPSHRDQNMPHHVQQHIHPFNTSYFHQKEYFSNKLLICDANGRMLAAGTNKSEPRFLEHCFLPSSPNTARLRIISRKVPLPSEEHQGCNRERHQWKGEEYPHSWMHRACKLNTWHYTCKSTDALQECSSHVFEERSCFPENFISSASATIHSFTPALVSIQGCVYNQIYVKKTCAMALDVPTGNMVYTGKCCYSWENSQFT